MDASVRHRRHVLIGLVLPACAIAVFLVLLVFSLTKLANVGNSMRLGATPNMLWVTSRAQIAAMRLANTVAENVVGQASGDDVTLAYQLFESRLGLLRQGPQWRWMTTHGLADRLTALESTTRPALEFAIGQLQAGDEQAVQTVYGLLNDYDGLLNRAANKAMVTQWDRLGRQLDTSRSHLQQLVVSSLGILLAGIIIIVYLVRAMRDVKQRTQLLDRERAFSHLLIHSSGDAIVAVGPDLRCTIMNPAARQLFAVATGAGVGQVAGSISDFFARRPVRDLMRDAVAGMPGEMQDLLLRERQEPACFIDLRCFPLRNGSIVVGAVVIVTDVTERHAAQRDVARRRDWLEREVRERTAELQAALEREHATADLYRNFGTMISHQLRTPLAIVDSSLQRLMRSNGDVTEEELQRRGTTARSAIARLTDLIGSTLDAARLDAGQIEVQRQWCSLPALVRQVMAACESQTATRGVHTDLPAAGTCLVHCDPAHVEHIVTNLLLNAVKYSPAGSRIDIIVESHGDRVTCAVYNETESPLPPDVSSWFERYVRGGNAEGRQGLGIGLYMARGLARMQGGDVRVEPCAVGRVGFVLELPQTDTGVADRLVATESEG